MNADLLTEIMEVAKKHGYLITDYTVDKKDRIEMGFRKEIKNATRKKV